MSRTVETAIGHIRKLEAMKPKLLAIAKRLKMAKKKRSSKRGRK
jgi:hypothetical protein